MIDASIRAHLRRELEEHLNQLGYCAIHVQRAGLPTAEIARINPVRSRIAYGATVTHSDLQRRNCHRQLVSFSQRRTRRRSSIPFFIAVSESDRTELEALLETLGIRDKVRGGHVQVVVIREPAVRRRKATSDTRAAGSAA
jgi:hypothetical protein